MSKSMDSMIKQTDSLQETAPSLKAPNKNLYNADLRAELLELQSDIDTLFQQLQSLSRQRLTQAGSAK